MPIISPILMADHNFHDSISNSNKESVLTKMCSNCTGEFLCCTSLNFAMFCLATTRKVNDPHCPGPSSSNKLEVQQVGV